MKQDSCKLNKRDNYVDCCIETLLTTRRAIQDKQPVNRDDLVTLLHEAADLLTISEHHRARE